MLRPQSQSGDLSCLTLSTYDVVMCTEVLSRAGQLTEVDLHGTELKCSGDAKLLAKALRKNKSLTRVNTTSTNIAPDDAQQLQKLCERNELLSRQKQLLTNRAMSSSMWSIATPESVNSDYDNHHNNKSKSKPAPLHRVKSIHRPMTRLQLEETIDRCRISDDEMTSRKRLTNAISTERKNQIVNESLRRINESFLSRFSHLISGEKQKRSSIIKECVKQFFLLAEEEELYARDERLNSDESRERSSLWKLYLKEYKTVTQTVSMRCAREREVRIAFETEERQVRHELFVSSMKTMFQELTKVEAALQNVKKKIAEAHFREEEEKRRNWQRNIEEAREEFIRNEKERIAKKKAKDYEEFQRRHLETEEEKARSQWEHPISGKELSVRSQLTRLKTLHKDYTSQKCVLVETIQHYDDTIREPPRLHVHIPADTHAPVYFHSFRTWLNIEDCLQGSFEMDPMWSVRAQSLHTECVELHQKLIDYGVSQAKHLQRFLQDAGKKYSDLKVEPPDFLKWFQEDVIQTLAYPPEEPPIIVADIKKVRDAKLRIWSGELKVFSETRDEYHSYDEIDIVTEWEVVHSEDGVCTVLIPPDT
eukprot:PhF_6_TR1940/c0_g1_i5/m.3064